MLEAFVVSLERRNYSPRTIGTYADCLGRFRNWLGESHIRDPLSVTPKDLEDFQVWISEQAEGGYSLGYRANFVKAVRSLYRFLAAERLVLAHPAKDRRDFLPDRWKTLREKTPAETPAVAAAATDQPAIPQ